MSKLGSREYLALNMNTQDFDLIVCLEKDELKSDI